MKDKQPNDSENVDKVATTEPEQSAEAAPLVEDKPSAPTEAVVANDVSPKPAAVQSRPVGNQAVTTSPVASAAKSNSVRSNGRLIAEIVLLLAVIVVSAFAFKYHNDAQSLHNQLVAAQTNPQALVTKQTDAIVASVARLMQLPSDETPTVADVADAAAAKAQSPFFSTAENGDKVLMYVKKGQAILYRPSTGKVILVAPLTFNQQAASGTPTTTKQ